jgi:hypothetical protein
METESIISAFPQILPLKYHSVSSRNVQAHFPIEWPDISVYIYIYIYIYIYTHTHTHTHTHNPTTENTDDPKNGLYEKLENFVYCSLFFISWLISLPQLLKGMFA